MSRTPEEYFKVVTTPNKIIDDTYGGMNPLAAKRLGYPWKYDEWTILIRDDLKPNQRFRTIHHEIIEYWLEWKHHFDYKTAHSIANMLDGIDFDKLTVEPD